MFLFPGFFAGSRFQIYNEQFSGIMDPYWDRMLPDPAAYLKSSKKPGRIVSPETPADAFEAHYRRFLADCETMYQDIVAPNW